MSESSAWNTQNERLIVPENFSPQGILTPVKLAVQIQKETTTYSPPDGLDANQFGTAADIEGGVRQKAKEPALIGHVLDLVVPLPHDQTWGDIISERAQLQTS